MFSAFSTKKSGHSLNPLKTSCLPGIFPTDLTLTTATPAGGPEQPNLIQCPGGVALDRLIILKYHPASAGVVSQGDALADELFAPIPRRM